MKRSNQWREVERVPLPRGLIGQPPGDDVAADAWHATTIDAAGYASLDATFGRITATAGVRADAWLLAASRLTPRIGSIINVASQQLVLTQDPRGSVRVRITASGTERVLRNREARAARLLARISELSENDQHALLAALPALRAFATTGSRSQEDQTLDRTVSQTEK